MDTELARGAGEREAEPKANPAPKKTAASTRSPWCWLLPFGVFARGILTRSSISSLLCRRSAGSWGHSFQRVERARELDQ